MVTVYARMESATGRDGPVLAGQEKQRRGIFTCPEWLFYAKHD